MIKGLSSQHRSNMLRYTIFLEGQYACLPPLTDTLEMLDELMMLTRVAR
jgi:hypothetical protein